MSTSSKKMGFVDNFMARNVNISSPDTNAKWATLTQYIKRNSLHLSELYKNSNQIQNIIYIAESNNVPDMLFEFSKSLLALVEAHKTTSAEDQNIFSRTPIQQKEKERKMLHARYLKHYSQLLDYS